MKAPATLKAGDSLDVTVNVHNTGSVAGDEIVEAYVKTPQKDGPIHSLAAFQRVRLMPGESRDVTLTLDPRSMSSVDDSGNRAVLAGRYHLSVGSAQPSETQQKSETDFTVQGAAPLPK